MKTLNCLFRALVLATNEFGTGTDCVREIELSIQSVALATARNLAQAKKAANPDSPTLNYDEQCEASHGNKIHAIKMLRARTGLGLLEAKNTVEAWQRANGLA